MEATRTAGWVRLATLTLTLTTRTCMYCFFLWRVSSPLGSWLSSLVEGTMKEVPLRGLGLGLG